MSIKSISEELKLSKATVSWILSGQGEKRGFKAETIKRVLEYAESVQYTPNFVARSLSLGQTKIIGVIIPFIGDTFYSQLLQAIESEAYNKSYMISICSSEGDEEKEVNLIKMMLSQRVDGIIIAPNNNMPNNVSLIKNRNVPFVSIDRYFHGMETNYVSVRNKEISYELTSRLIEQGSKKIAILTSSSHLFEIVSREDGYVEALEKAGLAVNEDLKIDVNRANYEDDTIEQLDKLLNDNPDVDGFFFTTHYLALAAINYFILRGIDYNSRFNMSCVHVAAAQTLLAPKMNIAVLPFKEIGTRAVDILCTSISEGNTKFYSESFGSEII